MVNFGPLATEIVSLFWGTQANFNGFRVLSSLTAFELWAPAKLCGVEQTAPAIFGKAAITLGIGPHSSLLSNNIRLCPKVREKIKKSIVILSLFGHEKFGGTTLYSLIFGAPNPSNV